MKNFKATIQVAEDSDFRKTVLTAIQNETQKQLKIFVKEELKDALAKLLSTPEATKFIQEQIKDAIAVVLKNDPSFSEAWHNDYAYAQKMIREKFTEERLAEIFATAAETIIKSRLKGF